MTRSIKPSQSPEPHSVWTALRSQAEGEPAADALWRATRLQPLALPATTPLDFWTYRPPGLGPGAPLVVALHGCRQRAPGFDRGAGWSRMAERLGFAVLLPEQRSANHPRRCFRWYEPGEMRRGSGEAQAVVDAVDQLIEHHAIDRARVFVAGLSAGGAFANSLLAAYPDRFAGGSIVAGLPHGSARGVAEALQAMAAPEALPARHRGEAVRVASRHHDRWPSVVVWHGDADRVVHPDNGEEVLRQWLDVHGLDAGHPTTVTGQGRLQRRTWFGTDGRARVEHNRILGMEHGVPIDPAGGATSIGEVGQWHIDTSICSTRGTLAFWGIGGRFEPLPPASSQAGAGGPPGRTAPTVASPDAAATPPASAWQRMRRWLSLNSQTTEFAASRSWGGRVEARFQPATCLPERSALHLPLGLGR